MRLLIDREEQTTDTEGQCQGWWKRDARRGEGRSSCTGKFNHLHLYLLWPCPLPFSLFLLCCDLSFSSFEICCFPLTFLSACSCHLHFISPIAPPSFHFLLSAQHHLPSASMLFPHLFLPFLLSFPSLSLTSSSFFSFHPQYLLCSPPTFLRTSPPSTFLSPSLLSCSPLSQSYFLLSLSLIFPSSFSSPFPRSIPPFRLQYVLTSSPLFSPYPHVLPLLLPSPPPPPPWNQWCGTVQY